MLFYNTQTIFLSYSALLLFFLSNFFGYLVFFFPKVVLHRLNCPDSFLFLCNFYYFSHQYYNNGFDHWFFFSFSFLFFSLWVLDVAVIVVTLMGQSHGAKQPKHTAEADAEAQLRAAREERKNRWKTYEYHHQPDLTALPETCYPLKSRCRVIKVSNIGLVEDAEGKTMSFVDDPKGEYTAKPDEHIVRIVCLADTHSGAAKWLEKGAIPEGDIFIFAGDMTGKGTIAEVEAFVEFLKQLPYKHKIVVAGNHGLSYSLSLSFVHSFHDYDV